MPPPYQRGAKLDSGGEAIIYRVKDQPDLLLKVFREDLPPPHRTRIEQLIAARTQALDAVTAWPQSLVKSEGQDALVLPFVADALHIHVLFDRKSWFRHIPDGNGRLMVSAALSLAEAVARVHAAGMVICDLNDKNAFVRKRSAQVVLIDCDSFVFAGRGKDSISPNFLHGWLPPELAGRVAQTPREPDHDNFALARMIFMLLMNGSDPMQPALGPDPDHPGPLIYAFGKTGGLPRLPTELLMSDLPRDIAGKFDAAFGPPGRRPTAREWRVALERMQAGLVSCVKIRSHVYYGAPSMTCPWCRLASVGADPFRQEPGTSPPPPQPAPTPGPVPKPAPRPAPKPAAKPAPKKKQSLRWLGWTAAAAITFFIRQHMGHHSPAGALPTQPPSCIANASFDTLDFSRRANPVAAARAERFATALMASFGRPDAIAILERSYGSMLTYFGKDQSSQVALREKRSIVSKWPSRAYTPDCQTVQSTCIDNDYYCTVTFDTAFRVENGATANAGTWNTTLTVYLGHDKPLIVGESGRRR